MNPIRVTIVICSRCGKVLHDVPPVFKKNPAVVIDVTRGICPESCHQMLNELRRMGKHLEGLLNKNKKRDHEAE